MAPSNDTPMRAKTPAKKKSKNHADTFTPAYPRRPSYSSLSYATSDAPSQPVQQKQQSAPPRTPNSALASSSFPADGLPVSALSPMILSSLHKPSVLQFARNHELLRKHNGTLKGRAVTRYRKDVRAFAEKKGLADSVADECVREAQAAILGRAGQPAPVEAQSKLGAKDTASSKVPAAQSNSTTGNAETAGGNSEKRRKKKKPPKGPGGGTAAREPNDVTSVPSEPAPNAVPEASKHEAAPLQNKQKKRKRDSSVGDSTSKHTSGSDTAASNGAAKSHSASNIGAFSQKGKKAEKQASNMHNRPAHPSNQPPKKKLKRDHQTPEPSQERRTHKSENQNEVDAARHKKDAGRKGGQWASWKPGQPPLANSSSNPGVDRKEVANQLLKKVTGKDSTALPKKEEKKKKKKKKKKSKDKNASNMSGSPKSSPPLQHEAKTPASKSDDTSHATTISMEPKMSREGHPKQRKQPTSVSSKLESPVKKSTPGLSAKENKKRNQVQPIEVQSSKSAVRVPPLKRKRSSSPPGEANTSPHVAESTQSRIAPQPLPNVARAENASKGQDQARPDAGTGSDVERNNSSDSSRGKQQPIRVPKGPKKLSSAEQVVTPASHNRIDIGKPRAKRARVQTNSVTQEGPADPAAEQQPIGSDSSESDSSDSDSSESASLDSGSPEIASKHDKEATPADPALLGPELGAGGPLKVDSMPQTDQSPEKGARKDMKAIELDTTPPPSDSEASDSESDTENLRKAAASESDSNVDGEDSDVGSSDDEDSIKPPVVSPEKSKPEPAGVSQVASQSSSGMRPGFMSSQGQVPRSTPSILKLLPSKPDEQPVQKPLASVQTYAEGSSDSSSDSSSSSSSDSDSDSGSESEGEPPGKKIPNSNMMPSQAVKTPSRSEHHTVQQQSTLQSRNDLEKDDDSTDSSDTESEISATAVQKPDQVSMKLSPGPSTALSTARPLNGEAQNVNLDELESSDVSQSSDEESVSSQIGTGIQKTTAKPLLGVDPVEKPDQPEAGSKDSDSDDSDDSAVSESSDQESVSSQQDTRAQEATAKSLLGVDPVENPDQPEAGSKDSDSDSDCSEKSEADSSASAEKSVVSLGDEKKSGQRKLKGARADNSLLFGTNSPAVEEAQDHHLGSAEMSWRRSATLSSHFNKQETLSPSKKRHVRLETTQLLSPNGNLFESPGEAPSQAPEDEDQPFLGFIKPKYASPTVSTTSDAIQIAPPESRSGFKELEEMPTRSSSRPKQHGSARAASPLSSDSKRKDSNGSLSSRPGPTSSLTKQASATEEQQSAPSPPGSAGALGRFVCVRILKKPLSPRNDETPDGDAYAQGRLNPSDIDPEASTHENDSAADVEEDVSTEDDDSVAEDVTSAGPQYTTPFSQAADQEDSDNDASEFNGFDDENNSTDAKVSEVDDDLQKEHNSILQHRDEANVRDALAISSDSSSAEDDESSEDERVEQAGEKAVTSSTRKADDISPRSPAQAPDRSRRGTSEEFPWISRGRRDASARSSRPGVGKLPSTPPGPESSEQQSNPSSRVSSYDHEPKGFLLPDGSLSARKRCTSLRSPHFAPAQDSPKPKRPPAGTVSSLPFPSVKASRFGLIQEELARKPFQLLIAVMFLNKTKGSAAIPKFREFIARYPTPDDLAHANVLDISAMLRPIGLQTIRANTLIDFAKKWLLDPPQSGRRHRCLNYPYKGAQKNIRPGQILDDQDPRVGAFEIGHLPGCGPYALDSWRIFCRDALRGVAMDWNGAGVGDEGFEPEWKRVRPGDKELRAFMKWMWLREGWVWDPETDQRSLARSKEVKEAEERWRWDQANGEGVWIDGAPDTEAADAADAQGDAAHAAAAPLSPALPARASAFRGSVESDGDSTDDSSSSSHAPQLDAVEPDEGDNSSQLAAAQLAREASSSQGRGMTQVPATQPTAQSPLPNSVAAVDGDDDVAAKETDHEADDDSSAGNYSSTDDDDAADGGGIAIDSDGESSHNAPLRGMARMFRRWEEGARWYFTDEVEETPQPESPATRARREAVERDPPQSTTKYGIDDDDYDDDGDSIEMDSIEGGGARQVQSKHQREDTLDKSRADEEDDDGDEEGGGREGRRRGAGCVVM